MQAVILAAGRGSRMGDLVKDMPKPMLKVAGKTLLEHKFDALPEAVDEVVLVVGYLQDVIKGFFGESFGGKKVSYVTQENIVGGTADALWHAKAMLTGKFIVMMGDDFYAKEDIEACLAHEWALLVEKLPDLGTRGKVFVDTDQRITQILEHEEHSGGAGLASTNMFVLDTRVFDYPLVMRSKSENEYGLPQTVAAAAKAGNIPLVAVPATQWMQITAPEDIQKAEEVFGKAR
jgi:NDP-sugar pyrophosphorylase family protein